MAFSPFGSPDLPWGEKVIFNHPQLIVVVFVSDPLPDVLAEPKPISRQFDRESFKYVNILCTSYRTFNLNSNIYPFFPRQLPHILAEPKLVELASRLKRSPAQVVLRFTQILNTQYYNTQVVLRFIQILNSTPTYSRWQIQRGVGVIPKSVFPNELTDNLGVWGWTLNKEDMEVFFSSFSSPRLPSSSAIRVHSLREPLPLPLPGVKPNGERSAEDSAHHHLPRGGAEDQGHRRHQLPLRLHGGRQRLKDDFNEIRFS